jgi:hypothetical protein
MPSRADTDTAASRYHTGFGAGMALLLGAALAPTVALGVALPEGRVVLFASTGGVILLMAVLYLTTHYTFDESSLRVRCGPFTVEVPYESIRRAEPSASLMSGYAMSLARIEIEFGASETILISPADRAGFLEELRRRAPRADIRASV